MDSWRYPVLTWLILGMVIEFNQQRVVLMEKFVFVSREIQEIGAAIVKGVAVAMMTHLVGWRFGDKSVHRERMADIVFLVGSSSVP